MKRSRGNVKNYNKTNKNMNKKTNSFWNDLAESIYLFLFFSFFCQQTLHKFVREVEFEINLFPQISTILFVYFVYYVFLLPLNEQSIPRCTLVLSISPIIASLSFPVTSLLPLVDKLIGGGISSIYLCLYYSITNI